MKVGLDSMIWSYIGKRSERAAFEELEDELGLRVVIPPSILLEALRTGSPDDRAAITAPMTARGSTRVHPLPEARLESDELVSEARRLRPEWLRAFPQPSSVTSLEVFWTRKLWQEVARDPARVARVTPPYMDRIAQEVVAVQAENRTKMMQDRFELRDSEPWVDLHDQPAFMTAGWNGERITAWRAEVALAQWEGFVALPETRVGTVSKASYADWAGAWLDRRMIARDRESWNRFWYHEVDASRMWRTWIRRTLPWAQEQVKVGAGNARDAQHAAYLLDMNAFITADKKFAEALALARRWTPGPFAKVLLASAEGSIVNAVRAALAHE